MGQGFPEGDGRAVNIGGDHLVYLTSRVPELGVYPALKSQIEAILETVLQLDTEGLEQAMDDLGGHYELRDTFGSRSAPGALRSSVKQPTDLAYLLRAVLLHWHRAHSPEEAAEQPTTAQRLASAKQDLKRPVSQLNPSSDEEAYARSLMQEDDLRPHIRRRSTQ